MGNSTRSLQDVIDAVSTIGDLSPVLAVAGFSQRPALDIANSVMVDILSERFNWKFNRMIVPPFYTISWQQDYASAVNNIGWLENACVIDINNTALPKPLFWLECVRDLPRSSFQFGRPSQLCWLPNDQIVQGAWPGANKPYTNPLGAVQTPSNPPTNILDANGNILILTVYGVTGGVAPLAAAGAAAGTNVVDGTCTWTVVDPKAQGFRLGWLPPQQGVVYQINVVAQAKPVRFANLAQKLDPLPDDFSKFFEDGFIAYCYRNSPAPPVRARYAEMKQQWLLSLQEAKGSRDKEREAACFVPERNIMQDGSFTQPSGAEWPYGPFGPGN